MSNIALFDLDGTLADFDGAMRDRMRALSAPNEPEWNPDSEDTEPDYIKARRCMIKNTPGFWAGLKPMADGFDLLGAAHRLGYSPVVLSRGPGQNPNAWKEKVEWSRQSIPFGHGITLTEDKGLVYGRVLVDDWPPYIMAWLKYRPRGMVIMPNRRWNREFSHPQVFRFERDTRGSYEDAYEILRKQLESSPAVVA
jgi:5'-nucleotidase